MKKLILAMCLLCAFALAEVPGGVRVLSSQTMDVNGNYGSEVRATDPDGDVVTITVISMPEGMIWDPETNWWHWAPNGDQIGIHYLVVKATDPDGASDVGCFILYVVQRNRPPRLTEEFVAQLTEWMNITW